MTELRGIYFTPEEVEAMMWLVESEVDLRNTAEPDEQILPTKSGIPVPSEQTLKHVRLKLTLMPGQLPLEAR